MLITAIIVGTLVIFVIVFNLKSPGKRIEHRIRPLGELANESVQRSISHLLGPPLLEGNTIEFLENGDQIFPAMLAAIRGAKVSITFETFIYWSGKIGREFAEALCERSRSGIHVHVLLDWVGSSKMDEKSIEQMIECGAQVERYHPLRWYNLTRVNNRTHRKILVVDGEVGFTGGVGIADQWMGNAQDAEHWRDLHCRITGPSVLQLQAAFMDNWNSTHPKVLHGESYFPKPNTDGKTKAQVFKSSPEEGSGSVRLMYLYSIAHAEKSIRLANAYFVPDSHVRKLLIEAAERGVKIEVVVPGEKIDTAVTRHASRAVWGDLLRAGIRIFEYSPTMLHAKYMVVDDVWFSVGSTNFDNRSFRLNDECNLNGLDAERAAALSAIFEKDRSNAVEMTYEQWKNRPFREKLVEKAASLFSSQV